MPLYTQEEVDKKLRERDGFYERGAVASGRIVIMPPELHGDGITKHSETEVTVHAAPPGKRRRKFDGKKRRHCSQCPFPEGCGMCTLP